MPLSFLFYKELNMQHKDIPDGERHEPKGVSTAQSGAVYVANGTGSGTWVPREEAYGELFASAKTISVAVAGTYYPIEDISTGLSNNMTLDGATGEITVDSAGVYRLAFNAVSSISGASKEDITFRYTVNGTPATRTIAVTSSHALEKQSCAANALVDLQVGDVIKVEVTCEAIRDVLLTDFSINAVKLFK